MLGKGSRVDDCGGGVVVVVGVKRAGCVWVCCRSGWGGKLWGVRNGGQGVCVVVVVRELSEQVVCGVL